ncbi:MAG: 1-deoxy-D-xylulose-5-phosphate reductoisomerase [Kiritimatiellae bacterium]|jgi:1-deoxy-D-xylulose-5-phosphate reductoisomerase|nr:1-deoxy-D-xylulose-5-phosphate reductoisomerase [Kiritimatiellia bacterium]
MKSIVILGSTGSIGENALRVVKSLPGQMRVVGLAASTSAQRVIEQAVEFGVRRVAIKDAAAAEMVRELAAEHDIEVLCSDEGVAELAGSPDADIVICALVGLSGLRPVIAAIEAGHDVALATKEVLVAAGQLVMDLARKHGVNILPVDSEHSALFQCMQAQDASLACIQRGTGSVPSEGPGSPVKKLVLTASGGPFARQADVDFDSVTIEEALNHPRWKMGPKVTIDSATMMNKGFEILEARWLFNVPVEQIDVVVHPESIVHSMVSFVDGSTLAQLADPDMRLAIQYALTWPDRYPLDISLTDLIAQQSLTFYKPDELRFPCLRLIREAAVAGGTMPVVVNAADEVAVVAFLAGRLPFAGIWRVIEATMRAHVVRECSSLERVIEVDQWARSCAEKLVGMRN